MLKETLNWIIKHILPKALLIAIPYIYINYPLIYFAYELEIIIGGIILLLLIISIDLLTWYHKRQKEFKKHFAHYKPIKKLKPEDLGIHRCPKYISRESDGQILEMLKNNDIAFITGVPGMGKTRAAYEAAKKLNDYRVLIPKERLELGDIKEPPLLSRKKVLLIIDDLDKHAGKINLDSLISRFRRKCRILKVIVTCRSGHEYEQTALKEKQFEYLLTDCEENKAEPRELTTGEEDFLIEETKQNPEDVVRDGTPGGIVHKLKGMKNRYSELESEPKGILQILKLLRAGNIFSWDEKLLKNIGTSNLFDLPDNSLLWNQWLNTLEVQSFIVRSDSKIEINHDTYLSDDLIKDYETTIDKILQLKDVLIELKDDENLFNLANGFYYKNQLDYAEDCYKEALDINPNYAVVHYNLGVLLADLERYKEAEKAYKEAIRCDPNDASAHYNLGVLLADLERYPEAEKAYKEAIRCDPNYASAHYNLGVLYKDKERYKEAEKAYKEAIRCDPNLAQAHYNLGVLYKGMERYPEAEKAYKEAIRCDSNLALAHYNLGVLLDDLERYPEAEKAYKEAIRCDPNYGSAHFNLGVLLDDLERYPEAEKAYKEAIRCDPNKAEAHANLGLLYINLERIKNAREELIIAREIFLKQGRHEYVNKIDDILEELEDTTK